MTRVAFMLAVVLLTHDGANAQPQTTNWPGFRGGIASAIAAGSAPSTWDVTKSINIAWKTPIAGLAISSPIVWNDRIYLTTAVPMAPPREMDFRQRHVWKLISVDRATGRVVWEQTAHDGVPYMQRHPLSSYANATPVTNGQLIVAIFGTEVLACYDASGKLIWKKPLVVRSARGAFQSGSSPVIVGDVVVIQDDRDRDSSIVAYRLADGTEVWRTARNDGPGQSTPAVWTGKDGRTLLVLVAERGLQAIDARTGAAVWHYSTKIAYGAATAAIAGDLAVSSGGDDVHAIRVSSTGAAKPVWSASGAGAYIPSPLVIGDRVYVLNDNGVVAVLDLKSGQRVGQVRAPSGEYCASPVFADGKIYVFSRDGTATVLRVSPTLEVITQIPMGAPVQATPAIAGGALYVRTATHLVAIRG